MNLYQSYFSKQSTNWILCYDEAGDKMTKNRKSTAHIIKVLRIDHDLKQADVAAILQTSQTMYSYYEKGSHELPSRHVIKLSELYNVSTDYIFGLTDKKERNK